MSQLRISLLVICCVLVSLGAQSQETDTIVKDGVVYYVYPFRATISVQKSYWGAIKDKEFFADYTNYFDYFRGDILFNRKSYAKAKSPARRKSLDAKLKKRWAKLRKGSLNEGPLFKKAVRNHPEELFHAWYTHELDVLPPFESIPDGKYVQLFDDVCVVDKKGMCQPNARQIAGYFIIKNNVIDGEAVWLSPSGDTLKRGLFVNGEKQGKWELTAPDDVWYKLSYGEAKIFRKTGKFRCFIDTSFITYKNGIQNGPSSTISYYGNRLEGEYADGQKSGEWVEYQHGRLKETIIERVTYASNEQLMISKKPLVRGEYMMLNCKPSLYGTLDLINTYEIPAYPVGFYEIPFENKQEFELSGEVNRSHEMTDRANYDYDYRNYNAEDIVFYHEPTNTSYLRAELIDSLGTRNLYTGTYERFYGNGQLFFRYQFENGELVAEDTIFWDNGMPQDVITFNADSNQLVRKLYDRKGVQYNGFIYDSIGKFVRYDETLAENILIIDGLIARGADDYLDYELFDPGPYGFNYNNNDTLKQAFTGTVILERGWSGDTLRMYDMSYNSDTRALMHSKFNVLGEQSSYDHKTFTENFEGWNGDARASFAGFESRRTTSGVLKDGLGDDTLPQTNVSSASWVYQTSIDERFFVNNKPYTGNFTFSIKRGLPTLNIRKNKIQLNTPEKMGFLDERYKRAEKKAHLTGKLKKRYHLDDLTAGGSAAQHASEIRALVIYNSLMGPLIYDYRNYTSYSIHGGYGQLAKMEGYLENGKPHGIWTSYDQHGKVMSTLNFEHGEPDGEFRMYLYQNKRPKVQDYDWSYEMSGIDSFPAKRVRYLSHVVNYKNGQREGVSIEYDWMGEVISSMSFKNDLQNGFMYVNDHDSYSEATFKDDLMDGYLKTYLTFPDMDTILLYDLNLQSGLLNGESKSYHINGKLAKRGFFLDGEPIEDYEAHDTLGFKYHYVKFQYGFPIEEKIWEENELSIRYKFNWEDSIAFSPYDITSTESLQSLLARRGYGMGQLTEEYFGRPRLLSKKDVDCHMTKYYPNDTVARIGLLSKNKKFGLWKFYNYDGLFLYEVNYFDSIISLNDSIKFKSKGILTDYDNHGNKRYSAYVIEKFEKYDCSHTDHYEIRQLLTIDEVNDSIGRMNGFVQNYYDNGTLQGEGEMNDGIPNGLWKFYDPYGKLNKMGNYTMGKRHGRWLEGDLSKKKYLGEICMNPNLPNLEREIKYQENLLNITIINYKLGLEQNQQFYDVDMNRIVEMEESRSHN